MGQLGLMWTTILATVVSAALSMLAAYLFDFVLETPSYRVHIFLAFVIAFIVTPLLGYFAALSMRDLERARSHSRDLVAQAELERTYLQSAVNNMPIGLVMFDANKRLIVCNDQYRTMYGLPCEITKRGSHLREMLEHRLGSGSFEGSDREAYIERILKLVEQKNTNTRVAELGNGRAVSIIHHPIESGGWVGTHEDVTERQKLNAVVETQNVQLDAALNNIVQGLAMYDANYKLVLCNQRYREIYGFSAAQTQAGTPLQELIEFRMRTGLKSDRSAAEIVDLMLRHRGDAQLKQFHSQLSDGRCIAITVQPMADGGTVTTHQDITEQRAIGSQDRAYGAARFAHWAAQPAVPQ